MKKERKKNAELGWLRTFRFVTCPAALPSVEDSCSPSTRLQLEGARGTRDRRLRYSVWVLLSVSFFSLSLRLF